MGKPLLFILPKVVFAKTSQKPLKPLDKPLRALKSLTNISTRSKGTVVVVAMTAKIIILYLLLDMRILKAH